MKTKLDGTSPEYWKQKFENESNSQMKEIYKDLYEKIEKGEFSSNNKYDNLSDEELKLELEGIRKQFETPYKLPLKVRIAKKFYRAIKHHNDVVQERKRKRRNRPKLHNHFLDLLWFLAKCLFIVVAPLVIIYIYALLQ